jgi:hypothetical protein
VLCQAGRVSSAPALLWRRLAAEFLGSAFLAAVVIGAGIAAQRLSPGQTGLQLLEDAAVIVPHDQARAGSASARAAHDGTSPFADRPSGPAQSH